MDDIKFLKKLSNANDYLTELMTASNNGDETVIGQIFEELEKKLKIIREQASIRIEREKIMWNNPESHFRQVQSEEIRDLQMEFEDRLDLFKLASLYKYEPAMTFEFAKMLQNLNDIRERSSIRIERNKIMWNDPESHFRQVQLEEGMDSRNEILDLLKLYEVAKAANFSEGIELISSKLGGVSPDFMDTLSSSAKSHK